MAAVTAVRILNNIPEETISLDNRFIRLTSFVTLRLRHGILLRKTITKY